MIWLKEWLQQLVALLMIAAFFDLVVTHQSIHRYVRLVVSLCILLSLLMPIAKFVKSDFEKWLQSTPLQMDATPTQSEVRAISSMAAHTQLQAVQQRQTAEIFEQRLASELLQHLKTIEPTVTKCAVKSDENSHQLIKIKEIQCEVQSSSLKSEDNSAFSKPIEIEPVVIPVVAITDSAELHVSGPKNDSLEPIIRKYVRSKWSFEIENVIVTRLEEEVKG
jgi:stage III sporulation protein AF